MTEQFIVTCIFQFRHKCTFSLKTCKSKIFLFNSVNAGSCVWLRVACRQTEAPRYRPEISALHYSVTSQLTHVATTKDVIGWEQLNATPLSHTTETSTGEEDKQTSSHRMMTMCTSSTYTHHTSCIIKTKAPAPIYVLFFPHANIPYCVCMPDSRDTTLFLFFPHKYHII